MKRGCSQRLIVYGVHEYWVMGPALSTISVLVLGPPVLDTARVFPMGSNVVSTLLPDLSTDDVFSE